MNAVDQLVDALHRGTVDVCINSVRNGFRPRMAWPPHKVGQMPQLSTDNVEAERQIKMLLADGWTFLDWR